LVRNARKTVQWTVFSEERAAALEGVATIELAEDSFFIMNYELFIMN